MLDLRVIRIIKVKIEITSDKKLMGSSGGERQEGIELSNKERERNRRARFVLAGGGRYTLKTVSLELTHNSNTNKS